MGLFEAALLLTLGCVAGIVSVIAGGAGILVYPGLVFLGLSPLSANATTNVALAPAVFVAVWADRHRLPAMGAPLALVAAMAFLGTLIGAVSLLATGEALFRLFVPAMLGLSTLLFWQAPEIHRRLSREGGERYGARLQAAFLASGVYSGYFGTGFGIVLLALLRLAGVASLMRANQLKNVIGAVASLAGLGFFLGGTTLVSMPHFAAVAAGNILGGYAGARLAHRLSAEAMRRFVIGFGGVLTLVFVWRYWLASG